MIRLIFIASTHIAVFFRAWMPSNIILDLIRTRAGLKWGVPAMGLAIPYFALAYWCTTLIETGAPGWFNLIVLICIWSGLKFVINGPVTLVLLARVLVREHVQERPARRESQTRKPELVLQG